MNDSSAIRDMLGISTKDQPRTIAVIGLSEDANKPSHYVSAYMQQHGYKLYPINPSITEAAGKHSIVVVGYQNTGGSVSANSSVTVQ